MRLFSAYINRQAAQDANSVFEAERIVKQIDQEDKVIFQLVRKESEDDAGLETAERNSRIDEIVSRQKTEIRDAQGLVSETFHIIRESVLLIHTQLDLLKRLMKDDERLESSGFPIEVADQLEEMLKKEIDSIVSHLRQMGQRIENDPGSSSEDKDSSAF